MTKTSKRDVSGRQQQYFSGVKIRYVRKAGQWCKTYFKNGKQVQEWHSIKPE